LAQQQGQLDQQATDRQTRANRPNQTNPFGSSTWSQDAAGNWTQNTAMNPTNQGLVDQSRQMRQGLMGGVQSTLSSPMDTSGMTDWGDTSGMKTFDNYGAMPDAEFSSVQQVSDAMMGLMQPGLDRGRNAEVARLKAQGLTEGSDAWNSSMRNLGNVETDAGFKSILEGSRAANDLYDRRMGNRRQQVSEDMYGNEVRGGMAEFQDAQRGRQMAEADALRRQPLEEMGALQQLEQDLMPQFDNFSAAGQTRAPDMYGAATDQYGAQVNQANARAASRNGLVSGLFGLAGSALGGPAGGALARRIVG
jgi:hypothetical protein